MSALHCCVPRCTNDDRYNPMKTLSFHRFPFEDKLREQWIINIGRVLGPSFRISNSTRVCSTHFEASAIKKTLSGKRMLQAGSIPTRFPWTNPPSVLIGQSLRKSRTSSDADKRARTDEVMQDIQDETPLQLPDHELREKNVTLPVTPTTEDIHIKTEPVDTCDYSQTSNMECHESGPKPTLSRNIQLGFVPFEIVPDPTKKHPGHRKTDTSVPCPMIWDHDYHDSTRCKDASTQTQTVLHVCKCQTMVNDTEQEMVTPSVMVKQEPALTSEKSDEAFTLENVNKSLTPDLLHYYTGFTYIKLTALFHFLFPNSSEKVPVNYTEKCDDIEKVSLLNQLFLVLCRLRQGFDLQDLSFRFNIKTKTVGVIFDSVVHYMYLKFTYMPLWTHRQTILESVALSHPPVMCVFGCTELKTLPPSDMDRQSKDCPDYKPNSTLKGLIAIDPKGSVCFVSVLFSENISDEKICKNSGFLGVLAEQKGKGVFADGDFIMTRQESQIKDDLSKIGLCLTQPPELPETSSNNLTSFDALEQRIEQIREFKLVGRDIPVSLFSTINEVWFVCALLVNFQNATLSLKEVLYH